MKKLNLIFTLFLCSSFIFSKRVMYANEENDNDSSLTEVIFDLSEEQPKHLYSNPQILYEIVENPLYKDGSGNRRCIPNPNYQSPKDRYEVGDGEHPRYLYSKPQVIYQYQENPLFKIKGEDHAIRQLETRPPRPLNEGTPTKSRQIMPVVEEETPSKPKISRQINPIVHEEAIVSEQNESPYEEGASKPEISKQISPIVDEEPSSEPIISQQEPQTSVEKEAPIQLADIEEVPSKIVLVKSEDLPSEKKTQEPLVQEALSQHEKAYQALQRKYQDLKFNHAQESQYLRREIDSLRQELDQMRYEFQYQEYNYPQAYYCEPEYVECCQPELNCYNHRPWWALLCPAHFEFYAAALYWSPTYSGVQYTTLAPEPNHPQVIDPNYGWGYKLEALLYYCDDVFVRGDYYSYSSSSSANVSSPGNVIPVYSPVLGDNFDSANGEIFSQYQAAGVVAGYEWHCSPRWKSAIFGGLRYLRLKEVEKYAYFDPGEYVPAFQRFVLNGWGPRVALNFSFFPFLGSRFFSAFEINGQLGLLAAFSRTRLLLESTSSGIGAQGTLNFPRENGTIAGIDFKLELLYPLYFKFYDLKFHAGYELHSYQDARQRISTTNTLGVAPDLNSNLGYGGPFFGLSICF